MHRFELVFLLMVATILHHCSGQKQMHYDLCFVPDSPVFVKQENYIHSNWDFRVERCKSANSVSVVKITKNNLALNSSHCMGSLKIAVGSINTELCYSQPNDCFLFTSKNVTNEFITEGCGRIFPRIEDNLYPITLTYKTENGFSDQLQYFTVGSMTYEMINKTGDEKKNTQENIHQFTNATRHMKRK
uniref:uncharacterized protein LOC120326597 n=1 Tax=Styela clava TaxID=7725 RepID=UPI001939DEEA|nr:uncharacterized protein LOC120326597 [Styela clava]